MVVCINFDLTFRIFISLNETIYKVNKVMNIILLIILSYISKFKLIHYFLKIVLHMQNLFRIKAT